MLTHGYPSRIKHLAKVQRPHVYGELTERPEGDGGGILLVGNDGYGIMLLSWSRARRWDEIGIYDQCSSSQVPSEERRSLVGHLDSDTMGILVNYNELTATSLESWLIRGIIP